MYCLLCHVIFNLGRNMSQSIVNALPKNGNQPTETYRIVTVHSLIVGQTFLAFHVRVVYRVITTATSRNDFETRFIGTIFHACLHKRKSLIFVNRYFLLDEGTILKRSRVKQKMKV